VATDIGGADMEYGTITTTPGDAADVSPSVLLASGTFISIHRGRITSGCTMPTECVTDALSSSCPSPIRSAVDATIAADYSGMTRDAFPVPTTSCPPVNGVVVTGGACLDGAMAIPAPPLLDLGVASIGGLFFDAGARGVMCRPAPQHQQNVKPMARPIKNDKGKGVRRVPQRH
jgi:hypothetical protein